MQQGGKATSYVGKEFFYSYSDMPKYIQKKTRAFMDKFTENPMLPGINYEKLQSCDDRIRSVRIDKDYRLIVLVMPDNGYLALHVDKHDEAYEWVRKRKFDIDEETNRVSIYIDIKNSEAEIKEMQKVISNKQAASSDEHLEAFHRLTREEWQQIQIPEHFAEQVCSFASEEEFYQSRECFPADIFERLEFVLAGFSPEEIQSELLCNQPDMTGESAEIISMAEHKEELEGMWDFPLEVWRLFIHPSQKKLVEMNAAGPVSITGNPGTGKTVLAMHRSIWLAQNVCKGLNDKVFVTTFSKNLAMTMKNNILSMCSAECAAKIEVLHMNQWVTDYLKKMGYPYKIIYENDLKNIWKEAFLKCRNEMCMTEHFYINEWNDIIVPNEIKDLESYIKVSRIGRGTKLSREQRKTVWSMFDTVYRLLEDRKERTFEMAVLDAQKIVSKDNNTRYRCIVVDEGQDLSNGVYKLIRALVGSEKGNDIYICSDVKQQIYNRKPVLAKCGINVRGRSKKLKITYRLSMAGKEWAEMLIKGQQYNSIEDTELNKQADSCVSLKQGKKPQVCCFDTGRSEQHFVLTQLKELISHGVKPETICITARLNAIVKNCAEYLNHNGIPVWIVDAVNEYSGEAVHLSTMHKIKGLEYDYVFIICANKDVLPLKIAVDSAGDEVEQREIRKREKNLLYVAATRARKQLYITAAGNISEFLDEAITKEAVK